MKMVEVLMATERICLLFFPEDATFTPLWLMSWCILQLKMILLTLLSSKIHCQWLRQGFDLLQSYLEMISLVFWKIL